MVRSATRAYVILARKAQVGVIFRRGPSKQVLLIKWDLERDTFAFGQWLRGRIYERRSELSPQGDLLLYFAANWRKPFQSWSAISRPPYLTALALWPKGDGWGGGGKFSAGNDIQLNHRSDEMALADGFSLPKWLHVGQFGDRPGWGEDDPVWAERLVRDGWTLESQPREVTPNFKAKVVWEFDPPITWQKRHPLCSRELTLRMSIVGMHEQNGAWYLIDHSIVRKDGSVELIGRSEWADWSASSDLLFSKSGKLFRLGLHDHTLPGIEAAKELADFSRLEFQSMESPHEMRQWPSAK
jgi:hypothetical protein